jgi:aspartyl-tRNA(Asn)/glutamyl-tRNA(Gln) amidotransferase subunit C
MALDAAALRKIAHLARLELSEAELKAYGPQIGAILDHIGELRKLDVEGVEPLAHAVELADVRRDDVPRPGLPSDAALANAPAVAGPYFTVPRILDQP